MTWNNAKIACEELGENWILPTKKELNILYLNKENRVYDELQRINKRELEAGTTL